MRVVHRLVLAFVAAVLLVAAAAHAQPWSRVERKPGPPPPPPELGQVLAENAERLGIDALTLDRIDALAREGRASADARRAELQRLRDEMRVLLDVDSPDERAVMAQQDRIGAAETALRKDRLKTMLGVRALLTPEQRAWLVAQHDERERGLRNGARPPAPYTRAR